MGEFARERRLYLPIQAVPDRVKAAFLSAEDKNFYNHPGVDVTGLFRAVMTNFQNMGSGRRQVGASTITQQVAKNFLLSSDQTYERKIKEMILAFRIEQAYSKDRILELYVNEIFFGLGSYGVAGAALTYYDKSVNELTLAGGRLSGGAAERSLQLPSVQIYRSGDRAPQLGDRPDGRQWLRDARGRRQGQGGRARRFAAPQRHLPVRRRVFHRGSAPRDHLALWRGCALRGRACRCAPRSIRSCS